MRIQYLNGGLANQVFQYIFTRFAELYNPSEEPWFIDDSFFFINNVHNGYELEEVFGIKANLLSRNFDPDVWQEFINNKKEGISIAQSFKKLGFPVEMVAENSGIEQHNPFDGKIYSIVPNEFHPEVTRLPGEVVYYHGYWINTKWFRTYADILEQELQFPVIEDARNLGYAEHISTSLSVAVHIRRGDYVTLGWALNHNYYKESIEHLIKDNPDAVLFIFSDELKSCRENFENLGLNLAKETVFVEGNIKKESYRDLQLMSMCKGMIMSNSAFCYLAALLNKDLKICIEQKYVYNERDGI